ncbi:hypothetical protein I316_01239 [Kwoniella heveanensis BCC8398]|uniref:Uncharacterized protein n=1 Tax=Kwoniella heveanensis BCC8398 TaxID=1296120 RepID=A0A1B9H248_9TREE|nr:hypothetical protein I316_01239 [Kwoniella heveanensis BCC8398]
MVISSQGLIPSTFLPHLPRSQFTLSPLLSTDIIAHISILKELYLPPIHGGFTAADVYDDEDGQDGDGASGMLKKSLRGKKRERRFSAGLVETMDGIGLGLDVNVDLGSGELTYAESKGQVMPLDDLEEENSEDDLESDEQEAAHLDPFEREWAEKWLSGVVRRAQGWIEEHDGETSDELKEIEAVLRDATAVLAMMAGTSAAGSLTRHLAFPIDPSLAPALSQLRSTTSPNPALSPETNTFLASLSTSPTSPKNHMRRFSPEAMTAHISTSPTATATGRSSALGGSVGAGGPVSPSSHRRRSARRAVLPVLLHDAPMGDHLSVGVQTWGSAILLGRQMAVRPADYGLFLPSTDENPKGNVRVLELGAGTGLLSILGRKLLDLRAIQEGTAPGLIVATDFLESVLTNLKICVDLNFPPQVEEERDGGGKGKGITTGTDKSLVSGIHIAKLDWTTFPSYMAGRASSTLTGRDEQSVRSESEEMAPFIESEDGKDGFNLVLASDCVYDETHAKLLREVVGWVLKLPDENGKGGGTFHILSPLRPTFQPELESIDTHFPPLSTYPPLSQRKEAAQSQAATGAAATLDSGLKGEGLGISRGLKIGTRGEGKRGVKGRRGEGRVDEAQGYWWWEVGWG